MTTKTDDIRREYEGYDPEAAYDAYQDRMLDDMKEQRDEEERKNKVRETLKKYDQLGSHGAAVATAMDLLLGEKKL